MPGMKPFKTTRLLIALFAILDLVLVVAIVGANVYAHVVSRSCALSAIGSRPPLCLTSDDIYALNYYGLLALAVLVPVAAVFLILSEVLGWRRTRRLLDDTPS